jgi:hypothetical protein
MEAWLGAPVEPPDAREGYAVLVERWLDRFGPGTLDDIVWWLGATKGIVRTALADVEAVEVDLEDGSVGYVRAGDLGDEPEVEPWAALLPVLDPTTMGWKARGFYLDPTDVPHLFDSNGNAGTTAWWNGRIIGCWVQEPHGEVRVVVRRRIPADAARALDVQALRLTDWLGGVRINSVYTSRQMKGEPLP